MQVGVEISPDPLKAHCELPAVKGKLLGSTMFK